MSNKNDKKCAGTYPVSGYTREDGTKVSGYMRTCGAKHEGDYLIGAVAKNKWYQELTPEEKMYVRQKELDNQWENLINYNDSSAGLQKSVEIMFDFKEPYHKYYKLSLNFENQKKFNNDNEYIKLKDLSTDISTPSLKYFIRDNLNISGLNDYTNVVIPHQDSELVRDVYKSPELKNVISFHIDDIKQGKYKYGSLGINFVQNQNAHLVLGHATLYNVRYKNGKVTGILIDYYDFDKLEYSYKGGYDSLKTFIANNNAYHQQEAGQLINYLIIFPFEVPYTEE